MTPSDLEREAARLREAVETLSRTVQIMADAVAAIKDPGLKARMLATELARAERNLEDSRNDLQAVEAILGAAEGLQVLRGLGTIGSMESAAPSQGGAVSAGKTKSPTLFQKALHDRGMSLPEWAATKKRFHLKAETAKNWVKRPGKGGRPVPRQWADRIAAEFGDPALSNPDNWPNGIRD